jgi:CCR4-NOT transcription complex subunit 1
MLRELYSGAQTVPALLDALSALRRGSKRDHDVYACVLRGLFSKHRSFQAYCDKDLRITASLLGSLVARRLVRGTQLGLALRLVLDGLGNAPGTKMFAFGTDAAAQLRMRAHEWPQFCAAAGQIQHLAAAAPELAAFLKRAQLGREMSAQRSVKL